MDLIEIAPDTMINMDRIDAIKTIVFDGEPRMVIYTSGENFISTLDPAVLIQKLKELNVNTQYWAGR